MKRKAKVRRSRDLPPPDMSETPVEFSSAPAKPGRISIESVDEHKTGSIESVPRDRPGEWRCRLHRTRRIGC